MHQTERCDETDAALMVAIGRSDHGALEEVYRRHGGAASAVARHVTGNPDIADDVVQDVFVRLWERPARFDAGRGSLRAYLMVETHGRAVDRLRADAARRRREERDRMMSPDGLPYEEELARWELMLNTHLRDALDTLTDGERSAIELAYFGGHAYKEVASLLGLPEGTVKSRINRGREELTRLLLRAKQPEGTIRSARPGRPRRSAPATGR